MFYEKNRRFFPVLTSFLVILLSGGVASAGFFGDVGTYMKERSQIKAHTKNIALGVRELYKDRKSVSSFAQSAAALVGSYKQIRDKKANISKLLDIAKNISTLVKEYQNLAPKAEKLYNQCQPDLEYFYNLKDEKDQTIAFSADPGKKYPFYTVSENRIGKLSGAWGWGRVWDSVKENPLNVFRWGKLKDEYQYGKAEAKYALKCAQVAYEATSYFNIAKKSIQELLGIKSEIDGILGGDLEALLQINSTAERIKGSGTSIEVLGEVATKAANGIGKRFDELNDAQNKFVEVHKAYQQKYGGNATAKTADSSSAPSVSIPQSQGATVSGGSSSGSKPDLNVAMEAYQKAYQVYTKLVSQGASQDQIKKALDNLQKSRERVEAAKGK